VNPEPPPRAGMVCIVCVAAIFFALSEKSFSFLKSMAYESILQCKIILRAAKKNNSLKFCNMKSIFRNAGKCGSAT
jgi:hypothetical protein